MNKRHVGPAHVETAAQQRKQTMTRELCSLEKLAGDARVGCLNLDRNVIILILEKP